MKLRFTKMQGLGNDFLLVRGCVPDNAAKLAARLCDRHFGVGADGVIFLTPSAAADCGMRIFNADGSEAGMCGNGIRCVGRYLYDNGIVQTERITVETRSGLKILTLCTENGQVKHVSVDMGQATITQKHVFLPEGMGVGTAVSVGNPHLVIFTRDAENALLSLWGPYMERDERFPGGINVEIAQILSPEKIRMRVWERGCGITLACGTGACASAFAAVYQGLCEKDRPIEVVLDGGSLFVTVQSDGTVMMEGPAETVFIGETEL